MSCLYDLVRIPIYRRCGGYYLRWYYNGWHYWYFYQGRIGFNTEGEKYRTLGTQTLTIGTGQITEAQANAIRTLMNTREIYIYTDAGWGSVRAIHSPLMVYDHVTHGYEMEFTIVIGSRAISVTGFSPIVALPIRLPDPQCELDIAVATQVWMCKNWDAAYPGSKVYNNDEDNRAELGGLYTYEQIMSPGFCPDGYHVPTLAEWNTLITACGGAAVAGGVLKEIGFVHWNAPNTDAVDTYDFAAVGGGYSSPSAYGGLYESGMFWTADPYDTAPVPPNTFASYIRMSHNSAAALVEYLPRNYYMCLRLIKNHYCPACVALAATNVGNSNFTANWTAVTGATGYYLDVSTDPAFGSFVTGYHNLFVGNVLTYDVTGLAPGITYYYRMRSQTIYCTSIYSNSISQTPYGSKYGALYNWYAATDARDITSSDDWVVPRYPILLNPSGDFHILGTYIGGSSEYKKLMEAGFTYWILGEGTNDFGFNGRGAGRRDEDGTFDYIKEGMDMWTYRSNDFNPTLAVVANLQTPIFNYPSNGFNSYNKNKGLSIRLVRTSTLLINGETGTYTGNNGRVYRTICIDTVEYLADNLAETLFRDGSPIPEVTNAAAWAALTTGARCSYNNDPSYI